MSMKLTFPDAEYGVILWAANRGILAESDAEMQSMKTLEEVTELVWATKIDDKEKIKDAIGDVAVTLILVAHFTGTTVEECLSDAYHIIKERQGKMVDGVFVKDE